MTKLDALKALLTKVEAGDLHKQKYGGMSLATACYETDSDGIIIGSSWNDAAVMESYNGSLDGAKALHEALLLGYHYSIDSEDNGVCIFDHLMCNAQVVKNDTIARAWLIAIIKALIAMEESE